MYIGRRLAYIFIMTRKKLGRPPKPRLDRRIVFDAERQLAVGVSLRRVARNLNTTPYLILKNLREKISC